MSESTEPQARSAPAPEELHWGISYSREDIQDLRYQMGEVNKRIDETNKRIDETNLSLGERIDETNRRIEALHKRIDAYFIMDHDHLSRHRQHPHRRYQALTGDTHAKRL